jgi:6-phosphogluconolactonase
VRHSGKFDLRVVEDAEALSRAVAELILGRAKETLREKEYFSIVLSGGSTPKLLYTLLASDASVRERLEWNKMHFFWGDERHVPPEHPESNYWMAYDGMLSKVNIPTKNVHRVRAEDPDAGKVADEYETGLKSFFKLRAGELPKLDCVLLGMGPDGHTASLFPGTTALYEQERLVVSNWVKELQTFRITMTPPVLNNAHCIVFLVSGEEKAEILRQVLQGERQPNRLPSQLIQPTHGELLWLVDQAAARCLNLEG